MSIAEDTGPVEIVRRGWLLDLSPLRESPAYLRFWTSGVAGGIGTQLTAVAIAIHVYQLSGSTSAVAMVGLLALGPAVLMGIFGGALVDAYDRRRVLIVASTIAFLSPVGIALLAWFRVEELWPYYVFTTLTAAVGSLVGASRFAIHPRLVAPHQLPAVAALSGLSAGLFTAVGPALAGILVAAVGFAWTYTIDCLLFLVGFWGIWSLPPIPPEGRTRLGVAALADGLRFLRGALNLRTAIVMQIAAFAFGRSYAILPAVGATLVGGGAVTVGLLTAAAAVGVILSGIVSGRVIRIRRHGRAIAIATSGVAVANLLYGGVLLALSLVPRTVDATHVDYLALGALCAIGAGAGAADNVAGIFRTTMMQSATPDRMRGRLQGLFTLVLTAGPRLGDVYAGFAAALVALWFPQLVGAVVILAVVGIFFRLRPSFRDYDGRRPTP